MSEFNYRWCLNEQDYEIICKMMVSWGMRPLHRRMLSEYGAIISKDGVDVCSGWLYQSDSKIAWIEWVVMSKEAPRELRKGAIDFLYETLFEQARKLNYEVIMCAVNHSLHKDNLTNKFGFVEDNEKNVKLLFKNICQQQQQ